MNGSPFLEKLPTELRLRIYSHLLAFDHPIKLRQIVPGTKNLAILSTDRQIHNEALSVLYDLNTIIVTRNDFCKYTDAALQTPVKLDHARHLLMKSFSQSIMCTLKGLEDRCDVCHPSAAGLIRTLASMPRLRTVIVDYQKHVTEFEQFTGRIEAQGNLKLEEGPLDVELGCHTCRLVGPDVNGVDILFKYVWPL